MPEAFSWTDALALLAAERIHDVIVPVVLDEMASRPHAAHPLWEVYLEFGRGYLQFLSVNNHGGLRVRHVEEVDLQVYRDEFGSEETVLSLSLLGLILGEASQGVAVAEVDYVLNEESEPDAGIVRCAELVLSGQQRIYLDPMHTFGVRIGNPGAWMRGYETQPGAWQRHTWRRPS